MQSSRPVVDFLMVDLGGVLALSVVRVVVVSVIVTGKTKSSQSSHLP